ncbi:hypothetical protein NDU88_001894 [Pleurodeles waltl]|uniref:Uncharacterized protein n=1 Tax=Pleurodeles waltl TaxID=8319 RepID=A0AAV7T0N6_PLEWA|nr:hypothetical protein NDU88_001894 [Pleurodeles waltl]
MQLFEGHYKSKEKSIPDTKAGREFKLQIAKLKMEEKKLFLTEKRMTQDMSLKQLDQKVKQEVGSSSNDGNKSVFNREVGLCILQDLKPSYVVMNETDKWLSAYEIAQGPREELRSQLVQTHGPSWE